MRTSQKRITSCTRCTAWGGSTDARIDHPANTDTGSTPVRRYIWCNRNVDRVRPKVDTAKALRWCCKPIPRRSRVRIPYVQLYQPMKGLQHMWYMRPAHNRRTDRFESDRAHQTISRALPFSPFTLRASFCLDFM